ncbi:nucleotidyl transferase AbiEii/AbiGii toxin family protein [Candidatus Micrarchaeota archaeon]|nr:nucleotidyl transferase AbiEii/AbiGii toxin family protein [Candidatus Micrarchaeota archaeon]
MDLNMDVCNSIAIQYGLPRQFVVKEFYVFDVLSQITMAVAPSKQLVFKGGTALNKVYLGSLQRFSEDLDFDLDAQGKEGLRDFCVGLSKKISGYEITEFRRVRNTMQFDCVYDTLFGQKDKVRVDVSPKKIIAENPLAVKPVSSLYTSRFATGLYVYSIEDLTARKLNALESRCEGKDVFDASNALPLCANMEGALRKMLESENRLESPAEFVEKAVKKLQSADAKKLGKSTNQFIPQSVRPRDWLELKNDLIFKLESLL